MVFFSALSNLHEHFLPIIFIVPPNSKNLTKYVVMGYPKVYWNPLELEERALIDPGGL